MHPFIAAACALLLVSVATDVAAADAGYPDATSATDACPEWHFAAEDVNATAEPELACLSVQLEGELRGCETPKLAFANGCAAPLKFVDGTEVRCQDPNGTVYDCQAVAVDWTGLVELDPTTFSDTSIRHEETFRVSVGPEEYRVLVAYDTVDRTAGGGGEGGEAGSSSSDGGGCAVAADAPAPGTLAVSALGGLVLLGMRRRRI